MKTKLNKKSAHKQLFNELEKLWSECIKARAHYKSELSGKTERLNSHHLIGKPNYLLRFSLENGICITSGEHTFGFHNEGRRRQFERRVKTIRGEDVYDKLEQMSSFSGFFSSRRRHTR